MLIEVWLENGVIKDAFISDTLYRGFEEILIGRPATDMPYYTQRICGICSSAHAMAASLAVEQALAMEVPPNGQLLRNLIVAGDYIQNHIRHLYLMAMLDYFKGPEIAPFTPHLEGDIRLSQQENERMTEHYFQSIEISRLAHAAYGVFGGKAPHGHGIVPGGVTMDINAERINRYRGFLEEILDFIYKIMIPDVELIAQRYPEYVDLGRSSGNYFSVGAFPGLDGSHLFPSGVVLNGERTEFDQGLVTEDVTTAWYKQTGPVHPMEETTVPDRGQPKGYTWIKAPRYQGEPMEVGPLARFVIAKEKVIGYGAIGRLWARTMETKKIAEAAMLWLTQLHPGAETLNTHKGQASGTGIGLFEAMRGALGHWIKVEDGRVKNYQIVTPSAWNFSSRDDKGKRSVGENILLGLTSRTDELKEGGRLIRSLDPCFSCTVHLLEGDKIRSLDIEV
ncbi:nickel-dependent hydrogenase large subunit [Paradesulfitobacterium ferrireducens]|uniref:nickel-dependent hydrogenase large subunit n=1 Tax=Paradesulfitobacterium ferrireducens TaxID=2816476 RepID=UPI001A8E5C41|nr:nickel-dependent hydrogenase large subunit [Paradesulfitobacterium ferrireducens]